MYSKSELLLLSYVGKGIAGLTELYAVMGLSKVQIYRIITSLERKNAIKFENGEIVVREQTHLYTLMNIIHDSAAAVTLLSGNGLDIIRLLREPRTAADIAEKLGISQRTVSRSIKGMRNVSMLSKKADRYVINAEMWPELLELAKRYSDYLESFDGRVPPGSRIYHNTKTLIIFSNDRELMYTKTAFSRFEEYGISIYLDTNYYCNLTSPPTVSEVMQHCYDIIATEKNWRLRMMTLIFYKKFRDELKDIEHPVKDEMEKVLRTRVGKVDNWVPLREMQERAEMYGVDLYDN